jgi:hypothetical protein
MADTPRGTRNQDTLACLQAPVHEQPLPRTQPAHRQRRRLDMRQTRRLRRQHNRWHQRVVRGNAVAVERRKREHLLTSLGDHARQLVRGHSRQPIRRPLQLVTRDRRRMHTHENLTLSWHGTVRLLQPEAIGMQAKFTHPSSPSTDPAS